jgi:prevent-host-death family protein
MLVKAISSVVKETAMKQFNIYEAKPQLSKLVDLANKGESFVIAKAGTPLAKLVPLGEPGRGTKFKFETMKGKIWIADDFDAPLPEEILAAFEGREPD